MWRGGLCPTVLGLWLACLVFLAACGEATTPPPSEFVPESSSDSVEQVPPTITEERQTHLTLRIEDESGALLSTGEVELIDRSTDWASGKESVLEGIARWGRFVDPIHGDLPTYDLRDGNPLEVREIEPEFDGLVFDVKVHVRGRSPVLSESVAVREGKHVQRRIVVPPARSVSVRVIDHAELPVVGASVTSITECERRGWSVEEVLDDPGYGSGVTGEDGRVELDGLGTGEHEFVVRAADGSLATLRSALDGVTVRMPPPVATGSVRVFVQGEGGSPVVGATIRLIGEHATAVTDEDGIALFPRVDVGFVGLVLDSDSFRRFDDASDSRLRVRREGTGEVEPGREATFVLGVVSPGDASLEVSVVGPDGVGRPEVAVVVKQTEVSGTFEARTDAAGRAVMSGLHAGFHSVEVHLSDEAYMSRHSVEVPARGSASVRFELGDHVLRGRLQPGSTVVPIEQFRVHFSGPGWGSARVRADGTFEIPRLRPGRYRVSAQSDYGYGHTERAAAVEVDLPMKSAVRLALRSTGSVGVRFAEGDRETLERCVILLADADEVPITPASNTTPAELDALFVDVVEGEYVLLVLRSNRRRTTTPVEVRGGQRTLVEIEAP